ncbi:MAG: PIN domain-containing protein [Caldilineaceae bacterium]|nr:PIN domain-containing protein [Caldilineaceae bacterium]MDE0339166.1 PIN domain-containing protein [Caldilineaceae bacterium]
MTALLDVNVLVALAWPSHVHFTAARAWFSKHSQDGWATCLLTEAGFVRISCNPSLFDRSVSPEEAIEFLAQLKRVGAHSFWPLDWSVHDLPAQIMARIQGFRQVTDALLVAAALQRGGKVATFDAGLASLVRDSDRDAVSVIPV